MVSHYSFRQHACSQLSHGKIAHLLGVARRDLAKVGGVVQAGDIGSVGKLRVVGGRAKVLETGSLRSRVQTSCSTAPTQSQSAGRSAEMTRRGSREGDGLSGLHGEKRSESSSKERHCAE